MKNAERERRLTARFLEAFPDFESYFVYLSFRSEAATNELISLLLERGKRVCVPRLVGKEMLAVRHSENLIKNAYGIQEPEEGEDEPCEIAVTPLLAVDAEGVRLGYGGGYYDNYFARRPNTLRVGFAFQGQVADKLPQSFTDIKLNALVTEEGVIKF